MWRNINLKIPRYMFGKLNVDDSLRIVNPPGRIQLTRQSYRWRASSLWNQLSDDIRNCQSLPRFKILAKKWILSLRLPDADINVVSPVMIQNADLNRTLDTSTIVSDSSQITAAAPNAIS